MIISDLIETDIEGMVTFRENFDCIEISNTTETLFGLQLMQAPSYVHTNLDSIVVTIIRTVSTYFLAVINSCVDFGSCLHSQYLNCNWVFLFC